MANFVVPLHSEAHPRASGEFPMSDLKGLFELSKKLLDDNLGSNGAKKGKELLKKCLPLGADVEVGEQQHTALLQIFEMIFHECQLELYLVSYITIALSA